MEEGNHQEEEGCHQTVGEEGSRLYGTKNEKQNVRKVNRREQRAFCYFFACSQKQLL